MISVSAAFKTAMKTEIKTLNAIVTDVATSAAITDADDLVKVVLSSESSILKTVMRQADITYNGSHDYLNKFLNVQLGVVKADLSIEYINYGDFHVVEETSDEANSEVVVKSFDKMYEALIAYDLDPIYDVVYPLSLEDFLDTICTRLGWTNSTGSLPNGSLQLTGDLFLNQGMSFRDVLDMIAEASASIFYFQGNSLLARQIQATDSSLETLTTADQMELKVDPLYGPINSVVLSRQPQEDNIVQVGDFTYRKILTVDETKISGSSDITDYPMLIDITDDDLKSVANGGHVENGTFLDIRFTSFDVQTTYKYELESYDATTGHLLAWVRIPSLSATANTKICLFYGNNALTATEENKNGTWASKYKLVAHLSGNANDSTSNARNMTLQNSPSYATSKIGQGISLDGVNQYVQLATGLPVVASNKGFTIKAWIYIPTGAANNRRILTKIYGSANGTRSGQFFFNNTNRLGVDVVQNNSPTNTGYEALTTNTLPRDTWILAHGTYNIATGDIDVYINGVKAGTTANNPAHDTASGNNKMYLGSEIDTGVPVYFQGKIDDVQVLDEPLTADQILTEYNNQSSPSTFYSIGDEEVFDNEIKIINNLIVDSNRETWIGEIFSTLYGVEFYPFRATLEGLNYFEIGDRITVTNPSGITREVLITRINISQSMGCPTTLEGIIPTLSTTPYQYAGIVGKKIRDTQIIVDKQGNEIDIIVEDATEIRLTTEAISLTAQTALDQANTNAEDIATAQTDITTLTERADGIDVSVSRIGGSNLFVNSSGLKGTLQEWQNLDETGTVIDADNDGTIVNDSDVKNNSESGSGIQISEQFITQSRPTIVGELYTLYMRFNKTDDCDITISGVTDTIPLTVDGYVDGTWAVFKYQFTATEVTTTVMISNVAYAGSVAIIADAVLKLGEASGWTPAPNESYGQNYRFDREGLKITDPTNTFQSTLDEQSFVVENLATSKVILNVDQNESKLTNLTVQDQLTIQRYENPAKSVRIVPTASGGRLIVND